MNQLSAHTNKTELEVFWKMSVFVDPNQYTPKPSWLKVPKLSGDKLFQMKNGLRKGQLFTVCEEAKCPNISECMNAGTATFMLLGDTCTRGCRFCNVKTGNPMGVVDESEPMHIAESVADMKLSYVVLTMVDRDDLPDGGAAHIARTVNAIKALNPSVYIEVLAGDFRGNLTALKQVLYAGSGLDVFAHNMETVRSLTPKVRDVRASYEQSLQILAEAKKLRAGTMLKSGIMLGLGEQLDEIQQCLLDMRAQGVEILTIGQYLQPSPKHIGVHRYVHPWEFQYWENYSKRLGFVGVAAGPLVRSSYLAAHLFPKVGIPSK